MVFLALSEEKNMKVVERRTTPDRVAQGLRIVQVALGHFDIQSVDVAAIASFAR
jgi:hypothetical protein